MPETWDEYFTTARAIAERTDGSVRGFAQRGTDAWHTIYTGFATQLWSSGGSDFEGGRCAIASPASVRATEDFLAALRDAGPTEWLDQRWYELAMDFCAGRYGLIVDSDHYVAYFEDPAMSQLAGRSPTRSRPSGPTGERRPNLWTWSVVMNTRARDRVGRLAVRRVGDRCAVPAPLDLRGQHEPDPPEIWDDERFRAHTAPWGGFHEVARTLIERDASVLVTPAANYIEIARRWVEALLDAYAGRADVAVALEAAAADIDALVESTSVG